MSFDTNRKHLKWFDLKLLNSTNASIHDIETELLTRGDDCPSPCLLLPLLSSPTGRYLVRIY